GPSWSAENNTMFPVDAKSIGQRKGIILCRVICGRNLIGELLTDCCDQGLTADGVDGIANRCRAKDATGCRHWDFRAPEIKRGIVDVDRRNETLLRRLSSDDVN